MMMKCWEKYSEMMSKQGIELCGALPNQMAGAPILEVAATALKEYTESMHRIKLFAEKRADDKLR